VATRDHESFTADVMAETLDKTGLGGLSAGARVNLERAVTASTRLGGHLVSGHVDGTGTVLSRRPSEHWELVDIALPARLARYVVPKGSICVDGVSLTVVEVHDRPDTRFTVSLIPETLARTTLGQRQPGELVNLEVDMIAKYVERLLVPPERAAETDRVVETGRVVEPVETGRVVEPVETECGGHRPERQDR
jgi:riboflavin synthase